MSKQQRSVLWFCQFFSGSVIGSFNLFSLKVGLMMVS